MFKIRPDAKQNHSILKILEDLIMVINGKEYTRENIGKIFDYALLSSDVTQSMVEEHVKRAIRYNVNGVYCNPHWVPLIADMLDGTGIETGLVPDFPFGAATTKMKLHELKEMCEIMKGRPAAIDFVINIAALNSGHGAFLWLSGQGNHGKCILVRSGNCHGMPVCFEGRS